MPQPPERYMPLRIEGRTLKMITMENKFDKINDEDKICKHIDDKGIYCCNFQCMNIYCVLLNEDCKFYEPKDDMNVGGSNGM